MTSLAVLTLLAAADPQPVTSVEGVTEYKLANGARLLLIPDTSATTVTVNMNVLVGSRHEGLGETGMAHLLEHLLFKGCKAYADVPKALRDHGAADYNGTTWLDRTNYYETMPATDANLEFGIRLETSRLVESFVKRDDLLTEMTVVRNEFEMGENSPTAIFSQRMTAVAYEWHNYGKSTIGNRADIERVPIDNLQAFYKKHYQPDNCVLVVAGKFDEAKALALVQQYLGALPKPTRKLDATYTEEPAQDGERAVTLRRVGKVAAVGALYHIPPGRHPDFAAIEVLNNVLTSEPAGRLFQSLVVAKKASSVAGSALGVFDAGMMEFLAQCEPATLDDVKQTLLDTLETLAEKPVAKEEIERAKTQLLRQRQRVMDKSSTLAVALTEWICQGDWRLFFLHRDRLEAVTADDVNRVAQKYLVSTNRTLGLFVPAEKATRAAIPAAPAPEALVANYKGRAAVAAGERFEPSPANIESRVQRGTLGGLKMALLPKKTRGEVVTVRLTLRYGSADSLKNQTTAAELLGEVMKRGTAKHTRQQLQDALEKLQATVGATASAGQLTFALRTTRPHLPKALELLQEIVREPAFKSDEFDILREELKAGLTEAKVDPESLATRELSRRLDPHRADDVRYTPTFDEELSRLAALSAEKLQKLYQEQVSAAHGELVAVGDFDPADLVKQLTPGLANWKSATPYQRIENPVKTDVPGAKVTLKTPDKENAVYAAGLKFVAGEADPDMPALELGNFILGGGALSSRLADRVRQKEGLSYGVSSTVSASAVEPTGEFNLSAISNPGNAPKVDAAIADEVKKFLDAGPSAKEVREAADALLKQSEVERANDGHLAALLSRHLYAGRTFAFTAGFEAKVKALTPEAVRDAFRKHVAPSRLVIIQAGDFKK